MGKQVFFDEASWLRAWNEGLPRTGILPFRRKPDTEAFHAAAHFVGGAMLCHGFRLFRNGGLPLLERRIGPLIQEIVIEPGQNSIKSVYVPLGVRIHVSHEGMREVRERYWRVPSRAPIVVAGGSLGLLNDPPGWVLWNVAEGAVVLEHLAKWVASSALEWLALFESPEDLQELVVNRKVPLLRTADALEFVLAEAGREAARRFLREIVLFGGAVSPRAEPLRRVDEEAPLRSRLDAIATCYRLR